MRFTTAAHRSAPPDPAIHKSVSATAGAVPPTRRTGRETSRDETHNLLTFKLLCAFFIPGKCLAVRFFFTFVPRRRSGRKEMRRIREGFFRVEDVQTVDFPRIIRGSTSPGNVRREKNPPFRHPGLQNRKSVAMIDPQGSLVCPARYLPAGASDQGGPAAPRHRDLRPRTHGPAPRPQGAATARSARRPLHNYIFVRTTKRVIDELKTFRLPMLRYVMQTDEAAPPHDRSRGPNAPLHGRRRADRGAAALPRPFGRRLSQRATACASRRGLFAGVEGILPGSGRPANAASPSRSRASRPSPRPRCAPLADREDS